jgi:hypothetical protein
MAAGKRKRVHGPKKLDWVRDLNLSIDQMLNNNELLVQYLRRGPGRLYDRDVDIVRMLNRGLIKLVRRIEAEHQSK